MKPVLVFGHLYTWCANARRTSQVYAFATREVPKVLDEAMEASGITTDDVDHLLLHQANIRIMETVAKRLGVPMDKVREGLRRVKRVAWKVMVLSALEKITEVELVERISNTYS